jgi:uncharacterized DUF497 family protein
MPWYIPRPWKGARAFSVYTVIRFEWHDGKAASNRIKHGVSFEEAITAFDDPFALIAPDPMHSTSTEAALVDR